MRRCETHFIQAGGCRHPEALTLAGGRLSAVMFPALVGLFLHPDEGPVLFDTGYDPSFLAATEPFPERFYRWLTPPLLSPSDTVGAQLAAFGLAATDIRWVVLSHFHGDHIAGLGRYERARILCSRQGLEAARQGSALRALLGGVLRGLIPPDLDARVKFFEDRPRTPLPSACRPFEEGADLFGDESLLALELPGHCPGHWGLVARGADDATHVLAADAAWSSGAIRENRPPPRITTAFLGSTRPYRETLRALNRMVCDVPEIVLTPAHCAERAAQISNTERRPTVPKSAG
jgi:glyoxylase-like metal-dependent hydrolase (beta-lactamase superfamily II)